jgi:hypothetical protein
VIVANTDKLEEMKIGDRSVLEPLPVIPTHIPTSNSLSKIRI